MKLALLLLLAFTINAFAMPTDSTYPVTGKMARLLFQHLEKFSPFCAYSQADDNATDVPAINYARELLKDPNLNSVSCARTKRGTQCVASSLWGTPCAEEE